MGFKLLQSKQYLALIAFSMLTGINLAVADTIKKSRNEMAQTVGVTSGKHSFRSLYNVCVKVQNGQYVDIRFQAELTNDLGATVGLGRRILRAIGSTYSTDLIPAVMDNITPDMHHKVINGSVIDDTIIATGTYCYYLQVWAVSSSAAAIGGNLSIEPGYGEIAVVVKNK